MRPIALACLFPHNDPANGMNVKYIEVPTKNEIKNIIAANTPGPLETSNIAKKNGGHGVRAVKKPRDKHMPISAGVSDINF